MKINKEEWRNMIKTTSPSDNDTRDMPDVEDLKAVYEKTHKINIVDHPAHYNTGKYETIDIIEDWDLGFHCGNAIKYIARHKHKQDPRQDIGKAIWYLQRYLERFER